MIPIYLYDGENLPDDDIYYLIAKQGIFLKKKVGLVEGLTKVDQISILNKVTPWGKIDLPKIPGKYVAKIISFFKEITVSYRSEGIVLLYYNQSNKKYKLNIPVQEIGFAECTYDVPTKINVGYNLVGTIHSHANMSAFHSTVDDNDEKNFDGLHITIGNCLDTNPSISASIVVNGYRTIVKPEDCINNCIEVTESNQQVAIKKYNICISNYHKIFNKKWLNKITKKSYFSNLHKYNQRIIDMDSYYLDNSFVNWLSEPDETTKFEGRETFDEEEYNPCITCMFKDHKLDYAYDILTTGIESGDLLPEENNYTPAKLKGGDNKDQSIKQTSSEENNTLNSPLQSNLIPLPSTTK